MSYLVLHVRDYDFTSERNGQRVQGTSVTYVDPRDQQTGKERGLSPVQVSVTTQVGKSFQEVPGWYALEFTMRGGRNGKPRLELIGATLERPAELVKPG